MDWDARFRADDAPWERKGLHPAFAHWHGLGLLEAGKLIYVPGCGRGEEPLALAKAGLNVTAIDLSPTAIDWQRARLLDAGLTAHLDAGDALAFRPDTPFDLYWEQTFLCAIPPKLREAYEAAAYAQLRPGGRAARTVHAERGEGRPALWVRASRHARTLPGRPLALA